MATDNQQPLDTPAVSANESWQKHEHVSGPVQAQAKALVDQVGSVELAKQAVESVAAASSSGDPKDAFARNLGLASYLELFEAATPIHSASDQTWLLAATPTGQWVAWTEQDLAAAQIFDSMESALNAVNGGARTGT